MPIYEYLCPKCGHIFTEIEPRAILPSQKHPPCEKCQTPSRWHPAGGPSIKCEWFNPTFGDSRTAEQKGER
jgi:putative FmdB family regulatory protein